MTDPPAQAIVRAASWPLVALGRGGRLITEDPVGVLLPAGGALLLQVLWVLGLRQIAARVDPPTLALWAVSLWLLRGVLITPLRALILSRGAWAQGIERVGGWRWPALLGVELVIACLQGGLGVLIGGVALGVSGALMVYGWLTTSVVVLALGAVAIAVASLAVRALFGWAPVEVIVRGRSSLSALLHSLKRGQHLGVFVVWVLSDLAVGLGATFCGAGGLPGYALGDLALLSRWAQDQE